MINQGCLNKLAADIAYAWDLHIKYSNNELMVQTSGDDGKAVCFLCLDPEDDADQPLRRDCACRGTDAGFVHLSCLAGYAAAKISRLMICINSESHGENVPAATNTIKMSLLLILRLNLYRLSEGSIHTIHEGRWRLFT
jgi:hypothetical protein